MSTKIEDSQRKGPELDTRDALSHLELFGCARCGVRVGWHNTGNHDEPEVYCDSCACDAAAWDEDGVPVDIEDRGES